MNYPKTKHYRNKAHLQNVAILPCMLCGIIGQTQASHSNQSQHGKSRGMKAGDQYVAALCAHHHYEIDQGRTMSRRERVEAWNEAHEKTVLSLIEQGLWPSDVAVPEFAEVTV